MRYWCPYFSDTSVAVGVLADATTVVGISEVAGIPPVAFLSYAVDVCDVSFVSAAVLPTVNYVLVERSCCCCWRPC